MTMDLVRARVDARWWIWGLPLSFAVHDGEEAVAIVLDGGLDQGGIRFTVAQSLTAILAEFAVVWALTLFADRALRAGHTGRTGPGGWALDAYAALLGGWTLHGLHHIYLGLSGSGYPLGVITALPAVVLYGALTYAALLRAGLLDRRRTVLSLIAGAPAAVLLVAAALTFGRLTS
ncbi:HXXEE domain-containing protein [Kitasatospora sp. NPDC087271]|uniref:HXXEE domain-containing protein n=1 Tax=Kitasatospora sp. NPDC087271 TaxID=3364067 RepID=UPI0037F78F86